MPKVRLKSPFRQEDFIEHAYHENVRVVSGIATVGESPHQQKTIDFLKVRGYTVIEEKETVDEVVERLKNAPLDMKAEDSDWCNKEKMKEICASDEPAKIDKEILEKPFVDPSLCSVVRSSGRQCGWRKLPDRDRCYMHLSKAEKRAYRKEKKERGK